MGKKGCFFYKCRVKDLLKITAMLIFTKICHYYFDFQLKFNIK